MTTCVPSVVYGLGVTKPGPACSGRRNGAWTTQAGSYNPENLAPHAAEVLGPWYLSTLCSPLFKWRSDSHRPSDSQQMAQVSPPSPPAQSLGEGWGGRKPRQTLDCGRMEAAGWEGGGNYVNRGGGSCTRSTLAPHTHTGTHTHAHPSQR